MNYYEENRKRIGTLNELLGGSEVLEVREMLDGESQVRYALIGHYHPYLEVDFGDADGGPIVMVLKDGRKLLFWGSEWAGVRVLEKGEKQ